MKTDAQIRKEIIRELAWDTRTWDLKIEPEVKDGVVMLNGIVPTYAARIAAQDAAHRVNGVLDVANELVVKATQPYSDEDVAHSVRNTLRWDAIVPDENVTSTVSDGWVTLSGNVETLTQRSDAEWVVGNLLGVKGVINNIKVEKTDIKPDALRDKIMEALERRADREAERLRIKVHDGTVDVFGRVHSWQERKAVVGSIIPTPGVRKVNDKLTIDPYF